jgi:hypothetical protein
MAFIKVVSPKRATGETAQVYRYMARVLGGDTLVARIVQMFSLRPASMRRMIQSWELTMWCAQAPRANRELLASAISRLNDCHY